MISTNAFHLTSLFCCFSLCHALTSSVALSFRIQTTPQSRNPRMANARNLSFRISLWWLIHFVNPVDKTKLSCNNPHRRNTTISLQTHLLYLFKKTWQLLSNFPNFGQFIARTTN